MTEDGMFKPLPSARTPQRQRRQGEWQPQWPVPRDAPAPPDAHPTLGKPAVVHTYRTASGDLAGYVCRFESSSAGKEFRPLTFCEHSGTKAREWRWKGFPPPRPPYGLERLAARASAPVVLAEGEKAADAAGRLLPDHVAVATFGGAGGAGKADWTALAHRRVVIWPDADEPGKQYAAVASRCLALASAEVSIVAPPADAPEGWDAADAEGEGWDAARARALVEAAVPTDEAMRKGHGTGVGPPADGSVTSDQSKGGKAGRRAGNDGPGAPQRNRLIEALGEVVLWHSTEREAFASVLVNGHVEHWAVRSTDFRTWLAGCYYKACRGAVGGQAMQDALVVLEALAIHEGRRYPTWRRVGELDGNIYIDLCDDRWRAVEITPDGWRVIENPPVKFVRSPAMRPLPEPECGELIERLRRFVNVETDEDFQLLVASLVAALRPRGPFPITIINGEQGSAKSTTARVLRSLVDPSAAPIRTAPRDERDLFIAAHNNWCLCYDNLPGIAGWLSDGFCRLSTGGGFATRKLHSDRDEVVLDAMRPIILNGISGLDGRPDLGDRALVVTLPTISDAARQTEAEFWGVFERERPAILGALYDAVACALRRQHEVRLSRMMRMADFAQWIEAAAESLGWEPGVFSRAYAESHAAAQHMAIENNPVARALLSFAEECGDWEGSATDLLDLLQARVNEATRKQRSWPASASALGRWLGQLAPVLRRAGVDLTFGRQGQKRNRVWTIRYRAVD